MRQSKNYSRIIFVVLSLISLILSIPKSYQLDTLLAKLLSPEEMAFFISNRAFFILMGLFLEFFGTLFSIVVLKYLYYFAKIEISLLKNANIYLGVSAITKLLTLILPLTLLSQIPFLNNFIFLILFMLLHLYLDKEKKYEIFQWAFILAYPLMNLVFGFL